METSVSPRGTRNGRGDAAALDGAEVVAGSAPAAPASRGKLALRLRLSGKSAGGNAEHVVLVGATQTGKSTAAYALLRKLRNLVVIDYARKGQFDKLGQVTQNPDDILRFPVVIWQPSHRAVAAWAKDFSDDFSRGLRNINTVRARGGVTVYHDEPRRTLPPNPHPYAAEMIDLGAGRGIGVVLCPQGFSRVYPPAFDNATHWFLFRIASATQRGSLESSLDLEVRKLGVGGLKSHTFLYWRQGDADASGPHPLSALGPRPPA